VLLADLVFAERGRWATSSIAGIGLLAALLPVLTLAVDGSDRVLFDGRFVVDNFALVMKALFLLSATSPSSSARATSQRATTTRASTTSCSSRRCSAWW
jgi:NADH:ubiquinone oxidoreductase subunit 2 (subunit N)